MPGDVTCVECVECGYDLSGSAREAACPECGVPVRRSMDAAESLSKRDRAVLVCRGLAIWMAADAVQGGLYTVGLVLAVFEDPLAPRMTWAVLPYFAIPAFRFVVAGLLWFKADTAARFIFPRDSKTGRVSPATVLSLSSVGMFLIGVYLLVWHIPPLVAVRFGELLDTYESETAHFVSMILGIGLVLGGRRLGKAYTWVRKSGQGAAPEETSDDKS